MKVNGVVVPVTDFTKRYDYAVLSAAGACEIEVVRVDGKPFLPGAVSVSPMKLGIEVKENRVSSFK